MSGKLVVLIDVLRASSTIITALAEKMQAVVPVASLDEALAWPSHSEPNSEGVPPEGLIIRAAERNGEVAPGFQYGNSPLAYRQNEMRGRTLVLTTTNGTRLVGLSKGAHSILIGSFLNLSAVSDYLKRFEQPVLLFCAGWKGRVNLEDSLFAGALIESMGDDVELEDDASLLCKSAWLSAKNDLPGIIEKSSHFRRLASKGAAEDIAFCLKTNVYDGVPVLEKGRFTIR